MQTKGVGDGGAFGSAPARTQNLKGSHTGDLLEELPPVETIAETVPARRTGSRIKFVLLFVLLIGIGVGLWAYFHYADRVSSDDAQVEGHISAVAPKIPGNVIDVAVLDNQPVKTGQTLVRIDPRDYQARVAEGRAALAEAESRLRGADVVVPWTSETTQSGTDMASAALATSEVEVEHARLSYEQASGPDLSAAEANVRTRQANNDRAQADLARMKTLVEKSEISQQQFDAYVAAARVTESELKNSQDKLASAQKDAAIRKSQLDAAESRVKQAKAQVQNAIANRKQTDIRRADIGSASAGVEAARANLEAAELQLSYTTITAPIDGVVTRKTVEVGQVVQPGQSIMSIIPLSDTWVVANFKETQLAKVRPGQRAKIYVDMYGKSVTGHVDSIASATGAMSSLFPPENATGNFVKVVQRIPVKILVDDRQGLTLRPGMNVDVTIFTR